MKKETGSAGGSPHSGEPVQESGSLFKSGAKTKAKVAMTATMKRRALKPKKANAGARHKPEESSQS
jgi:hypothetical protein